MKKNGKATNTPGKISAQPRFRQRAAEIQQYGAVHHLPALELQVWFVSGHLVNVPLVEAQSSLAAGAA